MCEGCCFQGVERRCPACSPRRTRAEREERRQNALRRAGLVRCLACDTIGPRVDQQPPLPRWPWLLVPAALSVGLLPLMAMMLLGLPGLVSAGVGLLALLARGTTVCAQCGEGADLWPARADAAPTDGALAAWTTADARARKVRRQNRLQVQVLLVLGVACAALSLRFLA